MSLATNIVRRGARYYFRARVPSDLLARVGRAEIIRALRTADPAVARIRASRAALLATFMWQVIREAPEMTPSEIDDLVRQWFHQQLDDDRIERARPMSAAELRSFNDELAKLDDQDGEPIGPWTRSEFDAFEADSGLGEWREWLKEGDWTEAREIAARLIAEEKLDVAEGCADHHLLCQGIARGMVEYHRIALRRARGDWRDLIRDPMFGTPLRLAPVHPPSPPAPTVKKAPPLTELLEQFLNERGSLEAKTAHDYRTALRALIDTMGQSKPISTVARDDVIRLKDLLVKCPRNWTKRFKGKPLPEVVQRAAQLEEQRLSPKTVNDKYLRPLGAFFRWASSNGYCAENPAQGVSVARAKGKGRRRPRLPFEPSHLRTILGAPLFMGCRSPRYVFEPGRVIIENHRRWAPLIALYCGARCNEIGQMKVTDVKQLDGRWCFDLIESADDDEDWRLKTAAAQRVVPIHGALIDVGFLEYVERARQSGETRLFPEWPLGKDGYFSSVFSKWFARFLDHVGLDDRRLTFHSFRHSFADALRRAGVEDSIQRALLGHADGSVTAGYGMGYGVAALAEAIDRVDYGEIGIGGIARPPA